MPEGWVKSSQNNARLAARGGVYRGYRDPQAHRVPDYASVLDEQRDPADPKFGGLEWSPWSDAPAPRTAVGLYRIRRPGDARLLYIGQGRIADRLKQHKAKALKPEHPQSVGFAAPWLHSWTALTGLDPKNLLEVENDLIAGHVLRHGTAPDLQFLG